MGPCLRSPYRASLTPQICAPGMSMGGTLTWFCYRASLTIDVIGFSNEVVPVIAGLLSTVS